MQRLQSRTAMWVGGTVLVCLVLVAATWFGLVSPRRGEAADLQAKNESAISANQTLTTQIEQLKAQFAKLPQTEAKLKAVHEQLPESTRMSAVVREVSGLADTTGMTLCRITPSDAEGVGAKAGSGQPAGAVPADGLVAIPLAIVATGDYFQSVAFLRGLQTTLTRAFLVSALQIEKMTGTASEGEGDDGGNRCSNLDDKTVQVTVTCKVFALLDVTAAGAGANGKGSASPSGATGGSPGASTGASTGASPGASPGPAGGTTVTTSSPVTPAPPTPLPTGGAVAAAAASTVQAGGPQW